ncbi:MAG: dCTP deaminase [Candidatus Norongarragalinales archaeon]
MILSKKEILRAIREERIKITPFSPELVGACSVDLRLGNKFKFFKKLAKSVVVNKEFTALPRGYYEERTISDGDFVELVPNELVLGCTLERLRLSEDLCARIDGRSKIARAGLLVHVSSSLVQPGVNNVQVLELMNVSPLPLRLFPGARVCQVVFEELKGRARYTGAFAKQKAP